MHSKDLQYPLFYLYFPNSTIICQHQSLKVKKFTSPHPLPPPQSLTCPYCFQVNIEWKYKTIQQCEKKKKKWKDIISHCIDDSGMMTHKVIQKLEEKQTKIKQT